MNRRQFALTTGLVLGGTLLPSYLNQEIKKEHQIIQPRTTYPLISKIDFRDKHRYAMFANIGHQQLYLIDMWNKDHTFVDENVKNFVFRNPILAYVNEHDNTFVLRTFNIYSGKVEEKETLEKYVEVEFDINGNIVKLPEKPQAREVWIGNPPYGYLEARFKEVGDKLLEDKPFHKSFTDDNIPEIRYDTVTTPLNFHSYHPNPTRCLGWLEETLIFSIEREQYSSEIYSFFPKTQKNPELHAVIHGHCWPLITELLLIGPSDML